MLGVVGAALGYMINLVKGWVQEYRNRRYRGTNLAIPLVLEREENFFHGLAEDELWRHCQSAESRRMRSFLAHCSTWSR